MALVELHVKLPSNVIFLTSNYTNKCTAKCHVVFTDVARISTSNKAAFFSTGSWNKREC